MGAVAEPIMKTLHIARGFSLPLETVTQSLGILAKRRAGKSYAARRITEQMIQAKLPVVIIDPKGDWWGIRSAADGKSPGLPVIVLGGEHGDLPLEVGAGEIVAKLVVNENVSVLLDLSGFRKHEVAKFMGGDIGKQGFLEALYRLKAREEHRSPVMLAIDEADAIAPQKPFKGEERMLGAIEDIVRRGGQRGIGCLLISQRSAVLNKNVLTQIQVLIAMRTIAPQDLDAMNAWIDVHGTQEQRKILMESLPSLPTGDAWFWSPGWPTEQGIFERVHILPIETFDSGATPKPGEKRIEPKRVADIDLEALRRQMAETIEKAKAEDPRELRKQIAELKKQIIKPAIIAGPSKEATGERLAREFERGVQAERRRISGELVPKLHAIDKELRKIIPFNIQVSFPGGSFSRAWEGNLFTNVNACLETLGKSEPLPSAPIQAPVIPVPRPQVARAAPAPARATSGAEGDLSTPERRILTVLAQRPEGIEDLDRLAILARYTVNGHFNNKLGALRTKALITPARVSPIQITQEGLRALGEFEELPTGEELQRYWLAKLSTPERKILVVLLEQEGREISLEELANRSGYTVNGHFNNMIGSLRTKGLMTPAYTPIAAAKEFFE